MNDIEILEEFIKYFEAEATQRKYRRNISITVGEDDIEAIENLIQRNKDLEEIEKEHKEENGRLREENKILRHGLKENTEEIDMLNGIINLMAEELADWYMDNRVDDRKIDKQYVINKFTNKVEEGKG